MALPAPDFEDCCPKRKCVSGPNAGSLYSSCDPCQGNGNFDVAECDCVLEYPEISGYWRWTGSITTVSTNPSFDAVSATGCGSGNGTISCTTDWFLLAAGNAITWSSAANQNFTSDATGFVPFRSNGYTEHTSSCLGSWVVATLYRFTIGGGSLGAQLFRNISGSGVSCSSPIGTYTQFEGEIQFSPDGDPNNITYSYEGGSLHP